MNAHRDGWTVTTPRRALAAAALLLAGGLAAQQAPPAKLSLQQHAELREHLEAFRRAATEAERRALAERMFALGPAAARVVLDQVQPQLDREFGRYKEQLQQWLPDAYERRLVSLDREQAVSIQRARRLWKDYVLHGGHRSDFQAQFLKPMEAARDLLLIRLEEVDEPELKAQRARLLELGGYRERARGLLGVDPDPTANKRSPTDIPYAHLDQPPTYRDLLHHTERTLVLAWTVAPPGARPVLEFNDRAAREIDVQEAEYVLYGNEMRLLAGTIAWQVDPLGNAVARDHSDDRTKGLAKGHMSSIPEKRGFTYRSRRMGARRFGSEGVGGGSSGRGYIHGLSYGGGHTGPLYSLKRNVVGVGRRGGAYTSIYATDDRLRHDCQALADELALPPGWDRASIQGTARSVLSKLQAGDVGKAYRLVEKARPKGDRDRMLLRFLGAAVQAEIDHLLDGAAAIEAAGDVFEAHRRLYEARKRFAGALPFDVFGAAELTRLGGDALSDERRAGEAFHRAAAGDQSEEARQKAARALTARHAGTRYAAAADALARGEPFAPFVARNPAVEKFGYPPR